MAKVKRRTNQELYPELLELIVNKLSFHDAISFSAVCSSWLSAAKSSHVFSRPIFLTIPGNQTLTNNNTLQLFSLAERNVVNFDNKQLFGDHFHCIGSSKNMLVLMDETYSPNSIVLINPFSRRSFRLPSFGLSSKGSFRGFKEAVGSGRVEISKAAVLILSEGGNKDETSLVLVVIFGFVRQRIAYCGVGEGQCWAVLDGEHGRYQDIVCRGRRLYVLSDSGSIEGWEFGESGSDCPAKVMSFMASEVLPSVAIGDYQNDMYFEQRYLVESMSELLLVRRFVGYYVNGNGDLLSEGDLLSDEDSHPLLCPYRTIEFCVYKACLGGGREKWERVECLGDHRALFLGGNESVSVLTPDFAGCEGNSIYFTDDNWDGMSTDYLFGGHDMGVYSLEDKAVKSFYELKDEKLDPPPFWIVPNAVKPS